MFRTDLVRLSLQNSKDDLHPTPDPNRSHQRSGTYIDAMQKVLLKPNGSPRDTFMGGKYERHEKHRCA